MSRKSWQRRCRLLTAALGGALRAAAARAKRRPICLQNIWMAFVRQPFLQIDEIGEKRGAPAIMRQNPRRAKPARRRPRAQSGFQRSG